MNLHDRVESLSDAACEVLDTATATGWSPSAATDTLGVIDTLVSALTQLGPSAQAALAPALTATTALRALIAPSPPPRENDAVKSARRRRARCGAGRHSQPGYWMSRDMRVAEVLWLNAQEGRGGRLADMFAALPPQAMIEAVNRRGRPEDWRPLLEELTRRYDA